MQVLSKLYKTKLYKFSDAFNALNFTTFHVNDSILSRLDA